MAEYSIARVADVPDMAADVGMDPDHFEIRFLRESLALRNFAVTFERFGGYIPSVGGMVMAGADGTAETVPRQWVSSGIFEALGVQPIAGRTFRPSDDTQTTRAAVLSEGFWRTRFGSDPSIVGREIRLDGMPFTVVGVVPRPAQLVGTTSIWALAGVPSSSAKAGRPSPPTMHRSHRTSPASRSGSTASR